jgi:hypothetical protein
LYNGSENGFTELKSFEALMLLLRSMVTAKVFIRALILPIVRITALLTSFPSKEFFLRLKSIQALDSLYDPLKSIPMPSATENPTHGPFFLPISPKIRQSSHPNHFNQYLHLPTVNPCLQHLIDCIQLIPFVLNFILCHRFEQFGTMAH